MINRKISNKKLSRNLKTKKNPLNIFSIKNIHIERQVKQNRKHQNMYEGKSIQKPLCLIKNTFKEVTRLNDKKIKKSRQKDSKIISQFMHMHCNTNTLRWIVLLIFFYICSGIVVVMIQDGTEPLKNIVIYSIIGFFTFFMGYIGWILARDVLEFVSRNKKTLNEIDLDT